MNIISSISTVKNRPNVSIYNADSNQVMLESVLPRFSYGQHTRALCVLDPYGLTLDWNVVCAAGRSRAVEVFINFPVHQMNRNCKREKHLDDFTWRAECNGP